LAYAERSEAWTLIGDLSGESKTAWPRAQSDAEHAVAIAPVLAEAHGALGWVRFFVNGNSPKVWRNCGERKNCRQQIRLQMICSDAFSLISANLMRRKRRLDRPWNWI